MNEALCARDDQLVKFEQATNKSIIDLKNWIVERIQIVEEQSRQER